MEYVWAILLVLILIAGWTATLFNLPGNWLMVGVTLIYAFVGIFPWWAVFALGGLAAVGELIEALAGAVGTNKAGGSRRGAALAMVGAVAGSLFGAWIGLPLPVVGSVLGALLFACVGAMLGAMAGEYWKGHTWEHGWKVGVAAFWGRLVGTLGKITIGFVMVVLGSIAAFLGGGNVAQP